MIWGLLKTDKAGRNRSSPAVRRLVTAHLDSVRLEGRRPGRKMRDREIHRETEREGGTERQREGKGERQTDRAQKRKGKRGGLGGGGGRRHEYTWCRQGFISCLKQNLFPNDQI